MRKWFAIILRERERVVIIRKFRTVPAHRLFCFAASRPVRARTVHGHNLAASRFAGRAVRTGCGQVAQVVERSPEKAGVGGSTPSLATIIFNQFREIVRPSSTAQRPFIVGGTTHSAPVVKPSLTQMTGLVA
jgi:hypothetical protein